MKGSLCIPDFLPPDRPHVGKKVNEMKAKKNMDILDLKSRQQVDLEINEWLIAEYTRLYGEHV